MTAASPLRSANVLRNGQNKCLKMNMCVALRQAKHVIVLKCDLFPPRTKRFKCLQTSFFFTFLLSTNVKLFQRETEQFFIKYLTIPRFFQIERIFLFFSFLLNAAFRSKSVQ